MVQVSWTVHRGRLLQACLRAGLERTCMAGAAPVGGCAWCCVAPRMTHAGGRRSCTRSPRAPRGRAPGRSSWRARAGTRARRRSSSRSRCRPRAAVPPQTGRVLAGARMSCAPPSKDMQHAARRGRPPAAHQVQANARLSRARRRRAGTGKQGALRLASCLTPRAAAQVLPEQADARLPGGAVAYALANADHSLVTEVRGGGYRPACCQLPEQNTTWPGQRREPARRRLALVKAHGEQGALGAAAHALAPAHERLCFPVPIL